MPARMSFSTMKGRGIQPPRGYVSVNKVRVDLPDNLNPTLTCEGKCGSRLRPHTFVGLKKINRILYSWEWPSTWEDAADVIKIEQEGYVYRCNRCGVNRIWGDV